MYILKFDISKYFYNIDHEILKKLIRKKIKDKDALKILDNIIDSSDCSYVNEEISKIKQREIDKIKRSNNNEKEKQRLINEIEKLPYCVKGKSLPIGNLSSQTLAILYLNELDHYILEELNVNFYERYMDDGILISEDKEYLKYCLEKIQEIVTRYKLELNSKTRIYNLNNGFEFLGFRYIRKNNKLIIKVKSQTKRKFKRKLKLMKKLYFKGKIKYEDFHQVKMSYIGHLKQGNTKKLIVNSLNLYTRKNKLDEIGEFVTIEKK